MSGNETKASTVDFNKAKIVSTYKDLNRLIGDNNDIISRLTRRLQTSLNSADILRMFAEEVKKLVEYDQFVFQNEGRQSLKIGDHAGSHSCQYNLTLDDTQLGKIRFARRRRFIEEELNIIERLASTLVFPLRNAQLYQSALESALRDELTGCGNKRALDASLHREAELSRRHRTPLSILMIDADHFKKINDVHGHLAGDHVLKEIAHVIKHSARQSDLCFRYGGEEFLLILDDTDTSQASAIAERIRAAIEQHVFNYNGKLIPVTVSVGSATFLDSENLEDFKQRADGALYHAKENGRNLAASAEQLAYANSEETRDARQHQA